MDDKVIPEKFRTAYVVHNSGHDVSALKPMCDKIVFCTTGYEADNQVIPTLMTALKDFDPEQDLLVPLGSLVNNMLAGAVVALKTSSVGYGQVFPDQETASTYLSTEFYSTYYQDKVYSVYTVKIPAKTPVVADTKNQEPS